MDNLRIYGNLDLESSLRVLRNPISSPTLLKPKDHGKVVGRGPKSRTQRDPNHGLRSAGEDAAQSHDPAPRNDQEWARIPGLIDREPENLSILQFRLCVFPRVPTYREAREGMLPVPPSSIDEPADFLELRRV
jgi:hypothetical protein